MRSNRPVNGVSVKENVEALFTGAVGEEGAGSIDEGVLLVQSESKTDSPLYSTPMNCFLDYFEAPNLYLA